MDFIDLKTQQNRIREGLKVRFDRIFEHGAYIMGPEVTELEEKLAELLWVSNMRFHVRQVPMHYSFL